MKYLGSFFLALFLVLSAYFTAKHQINQPLDLKTVRLGMTPKEVKKAFGTPSAQFRNQFTYILHEGSELTLTLRDDRVSSASIKFHRPLQIQDPELRKLTLVQMDNFEPNSQSWFFAGNPEEGRIYKISANGVIEKITWVPPFTYGSGRPKQLQALLRDFRTQRSL